MIYVAGADLFRYKNRVQSPFECAARTKNRCDLHFYAVFGEFPDFWRKTFITQCSNEGERLLFVRPILSNTQIKCAGKLIFL
jgi:hypothetical protein